MAHLELSSQMNIWKASITNQQRQEQGNKDAFIQNVEQRIYQNQPPTTVDKLEAYTRTSMKLKTFNRILHEMEVLGAYLQDIVNNQFPPEAIQSASYLMAMTMLDPHDLSKEYMKKIFKKMKIEQPISDHNSLICYGKLKPSEEDVIFETEKLSEEVKDTKGLLIGTLMQSPKYKAKIILLQQIRRNQLNQCTGPQPNFVDPGAYGMPQQPGPPDFYIPQPGMPQPYMK